MSLASVQDFTAAIRQAKTVACRDCKQQLLVMPGQREVHHQTCGETTYIAWDDKGNPSPVPFESRRKHP